MARTTKKQNGDRYLSITELSREKNISEKFLRRAVKELGLPTYDLGVDKIKVSEFETWTLQRRSSSAS